MVPRGTHLLPIYGNNMDLWRRHDKNSGRGNIHGERERESRVVAHDDAGPLSPAGDTHDKADPPCPACAGRRLEADH